MDDLSINNIKLIKHALFRLSESMSPESEGYESLLLDIHRINYVLDNKAELNKSTKLPVLLN
jgi:hypothetical protein